MKKDYLTLEQNLSCARIFLNLFGLYLDSSNEKINEFSKIRILNSNNSQVGLLHFYNGRVKIQSVTSFGNLNAEYEIAEFGGFQDLECGGAYVDWNHTIDFAVNGEMDFNGDIQIGVSMDTDFGNHCNLHSKIKFVDKDEKEVVLKFMDDGKPFSYEAKKGNFREILEINPWNEFYSFMYHLIRDGEYNKDFHCFPNEKIKFVWHNGSDDRKHLRVVSSAIENLEQTEYKSELYDRIIDDNCREATIQKGLLMQQNDEDFSKKLLELKEMFTKDNVSFFTNILDVTFNRVDEEERKALLGFELEKIKYHNGADNLLDAYFGIKEDNKFLPKVVYKKVLKK